MIPRIIHQTWKCREVPGQWQHAAETWNRHHPTWKFRLWTDEENLRLVTEHYPNLLENYSQLPSELLISGGIMGDTISRISEGVAESESGAGVGTFGGVEVIE